MSEKFTLKAELHTHSHIRNRLFYCPLLYDAVQSVETILAKATELNIKILSITNHDSMALRHLKRNFEIQILGRNLK